MQLAAVSAVLLAVVGAPALSAAFVLLMLVVAAITAAERVTGLPLRAPGRRPRLLCAGLRPLVPGLDQTRTVGLVTLPGACVGVLLGGGDPLQAGAAQLLVLVGLLAVQVAAVWSVTELIARGRLLPELVR